MRRTIVGRIVMLAGVLLRAPLVADAQPAEKGYHLGILSLGTSRPWRSGGTPCMEVMRERHAIHDLIPSSEECPIPCTEGGSICQRISDASTTLWLYLWRIVLLTMSWDISAVLAAAAMSMASAMTVSPQ